MPASVLFPVTFDGFDGGRWGGEGNGRRLAKSNLTLAAQGSQISARWLISPAPRARAHATPATHGQSFPPARRYAQQVARIRLPGIQLQRRECFLLPHPLAFHAADLRARG